MGRELLAHDTAFEKALTDVDRLIRAEAGFSVLDLIKAGEPVTGCPKVQPTLFALQIALAAAWQAHGVLPAAVIGHSMGEAAAAVVAGALTLADGVRVICRRSALLERIAGTGAMASVGLDRAGVEAALADAGADGVSVAVLAAPDTTVVSGDADQIDHLIARWERQGIAAVPIAVDVASHSAHVEPLLGDLREALLDLSPRPPQIPFYSTVAEDPLRARSSTPTTGAPICAAPSASSPPWPSPPRSGTRSTSRSHRTPWSPSPSPRAWPRWSPTPWSCPRCAARRTSRPPSAPSSRPSTATAARSTGPRSTVAAT